MSCDTPGTSTIDTTAIITALIHRAAAAIAGDARF